MSLKPCILPWINFGTNPYGRPRACGYSDQTIVKKNKTIKQKGIQEAWNNDYFKTIRKDFLEGKVTLPIIFLYQKANLNEKIFLEKIFKKKNRSKLELIETQKLIGKYNSINSCFERAEHFVNISYNALNIFNPSNEKTVLQNLSSFSLERSF